MDNEAAGGPWKQIDSPEAWCAELAQGNLLEDGIVRETRYLSADHVNESQHLVYGSPFDALLRALVQTQTDPPAVLFELSGVASYTIARQENFESGSMDPVPTRVDHDVKLWRFRFLECEAIAAACRLSWLSDGRGISRP